MANRFDILSKVRELEIRFCLGKPKVPLMLFKRGPYRFVRYCFFNVNPHNT